MAVIITKWIEISLLFAILSSIVTAVNRDRLVITTACPENCKCFREEIRCQSIPASQLVFQEGVKRM